MSIWVSIVKISKIDVRKIDTTGWPISSVPSFVFSHNALILLLHRSYSLILIYYSIRTRLLYSFLSPTVLHYFISMERERSAIIELFVKGNNPGEILKLLKMPKQRRKLIYRTIQRYRKTGGVQDMPRSGRPKSVTTPRLKKVVMDRIRRNPRRSLRKMAVELKVSRGSLQNLVRNDLGLRSFKRKKVHFLSKQIREKRKSRSKILLNRLANQGLERVVFSDEKLFTIEEATNTQNDRILAKTSSSIPEQHLFVSRAQKPSSVMVWAGISAVGRTPLIFVPSGVKINAATYKELILEPVVKDLSQTMFKNKSFLFQQDGAPAHTANTTQSWLSTKIPDFISKVEWPPSSPDLNPMDFSLWSILETKACAKSHKSVDSLKKSLLKEWSQIPQETMRAAVNAVPDRLRAVIKKRGGYIE